MKQYLKKTAGIFLGKTFGQGFFRFLYLLSLKGMNFGGGSHPGESGEVFAINYALAKTANGRLVIFDAGANKGDYTRQWLKAVSEKKQQAQIHLFEPSAFLCQDLKKSFSNSKEIIINQKALGESAGEAVLFADHEGSGLASLYKRNLEHAGINMLAEEKVEVKTLDNYCSVQNIDKIDFLKLDVEGFELAALKGGSKLIQNRRINFIQFEFGGTDIDARVFFKDFYFLLSSNYNIYRILKNGLYPITAYSELDEIFLTTNYFAELK